MWRIGQAQETVQSKRQGRWFVVQLPKYQAAQLTLLRPAVYSRKSSFDSAEDTATCCHSLQGRTLPDRIYERNPCISGWSQLLHCTLCSPAIDGVYMRLNRPMAYYFAGARCPTSLEAIQAFRGTSAWVAVLWYGRAATVSPSACLANHKLPIPVRAGCHRSGRQHQRCVLL